ncbi:VOC family protein [Cellulomonas chengniuliangii]|uniref:VOC family protein n=1 Tax=Cellulomonas chengniuliangii TaxID=2968084 RepID=A0ABY5KW02_9CELL|nr:VOC family protein [Cellulomonas chengniuliangii]MCC2309789.1 VOC family protein [Cellulomonas chengniuliangii]UUI74667.1 VOC family protein [Cellulomonas chengniuliangii]
MTVSTTPHLNFRGQARAALEFYQSVFGGDLAAITYADAGAVTVADEADQIMWGQVSSEAGFRVMAYDVPAHTPWEPGANPFFVSVRGADAEEVTGYWKNLADGSAIAVPLAPAAWAPLYGMLTDRFGVTWVLDVEARWDAS